MSWKARIGRWFGMGPAPAPSPSVPSAPAVPARSSQADDEAIAELRARIRSDVAAGFYDEDVILKELPDYFADEIDPATIRREAPRLLRQALAEQAAEEARWPAVTDVDRLEAAFAAMEADGIVVRQNFACCLTCGSNDIWEEVQAALDAGLPARGYAFFHSQDTDAAVEGGGLFLAYGACESGEDAALAVARDIVAALEAQGLHTEWDGDWERRIGVVLDWKKRRGTVHA
jgi:hypothetical protein